MMADYTTDAETVYNLTRDCEATDYGDGIRNIIRFADGSHMEIDDNGLPTGSTWDNQAELMDHLKRMKEIHERQKKRKEEALKAMSNNPFEDDDE